MTQTISHHSALIYIMVIVSAADGKMSDEELRMMGDIVSKFPIFDDFDASQIIQVAGDCTEILSGEGGLETVLGLIKNAIPSRLAETAYSVAVDIAVADQKLNPEELRLLELLRDCLMIDRLYAGAIERAARARYTTL